MKLGNNKQNSVLSVFSQVKALEDTFDTVMIVDPINKKVMSINEAVIKETKNSCLENCPLKNDSNGCVCSYVISNNDTRQRFIFDSKQAFLVIGKPVEIAYRHLVLVMILKLSPKFQFGNHKTEEAIDSIVKVSSNLVIDPLTKIFNRKYLYDNIDYLISRSFSKQKPLCMACIDIDNFKRFNDTYGHDFGDKVLVSVATLMAKSIETIEEAYPIRLGGDEFIIVALDVDKKRFKAIMNKLCGLVAEHKLKFNNTNVGICISIGVSEVLDDNVKTYKELYDKADKALYKAKEDGKGCVR